MALRIVKQKEGQSAVICSDSYNAVIKFTKIEYKDSLVRKIQHDINELMGRRTRVVLCWVPGHSGVRGNEIANEAATVAITREKTMVPISYTSYTAVADAALAEKCNEDWMRARSKMREVKENCEVWEENKDCLSRSSKTEPAKDRLGIT